MLGLMQEWPLLCHKLIDNADQPAWRTRDRVALDRGPDRPDHLRRNSSPRLEGRERLERDGFGLGDRIATLAWNTARHIEAWYGIMGVGAIYHTLNPRLFPEQIAWIMNNAEDKAIFVDLTFMPVLEKIAGAVKSLKQVIVLTDKAHMPQTALPNAVAYEEWLDEADGAFTWKTFDENTAAGMCYTSGTTGDPKGVLYSHRSNVLHAMIAAMPDAMGSLVARHHTAGCADVPCQCLGPWPERPDDRRQAGHAWLQDGRRLDL